MACRAIIVTGACLEYDVVNHGAIFDHDSVLHSGTYVSPMVAAGCMSIGSTFNRYWSHLVPNITIGEGFTVGAGSLILFNLHSRVLAYDSPVKVVKKPEGPVNPYTSISRARI